MKKYLLDLEVKENKRLHHDYCLLKLTSADPLPAMKPGQFAEVRVDGSASTFLRRPISINYVDRAANELWLLVRPVGAGTHRMADCRTGDTMNLLLPLGNGFSIPHEPNRKLLLVGGGVGVAPLLFLGSTLKEAGYNPHFLIGARTGDDLLLSDDFRRLGTVYITTENGSTGEKGLVTQHSILSDGRFDRIYACGPKPMMIAVAGYAASAGISCEVSLENTMACGIGACLCCVEKTVNGHVCTCTEGPVFNINQLTWPN
ncbi:MAG: dihydroorotate dehydrogenase electron transfer subunit [Tannerella sp.]|jgi:dihydroorotate dehydrogenase electron transfer subunit|nr:dihydroorotate dehydrogenase electron transfer subunit [Tannerella sp.]